MSVSVFGRGSDREVLVSISVLQLFAIGCFGVSAAGG